jgi:hypothetical protein
MQTRLKEIILGVTPQLEVLTNEHVSFKPNLERPTIVCLCGSTRFFEAFSKLNLEETLAGRIVLSIASDRQTEENILDTLSEIELEQVKQKLEKLHFQKIDLADEILVVNVNGYVGESTTREILYARENRKHVRWLEPESIPIHLKEVTHDSIQ